ncbi:hypothetical protein BGW41_007563 [Actinomortierella wolfii]|nr:hypothetical protein BGW41_007563 [Actinomortierella wolfii]
MSFYGVVHQNDEVWLITDYAERGSLKRAIDNALLVGWEIKKRIAQDIAKGLAYIHHEGILHRDLKSANVLLTKSMEVKLCDFGLAIVKDLIEAPSANTLYGTVRWMAPELLNDRPQYSAKSDVYALGMVMWEMAAMCTVPFKRTFDPKAILAGYRERLPGGTPEDYRLWVRPEANDIDLVDDVLSARWRARSLKRHLDTT